LLIKFHISIRDSTDVSESFVLSEHFQEFHSERVEVSKTVQSGIECCDFLGSDTSVLGEKLEGFRVVIESFDVDNILINGVERLLFGS